MGHFRPIPTSSIGNQSRKWMIPSDLCLAELRESFFLFSKLIVPWREFELDNPFVAEKFAEMMSFLLGYIN